jgi:pimeloyl-ACP methyl ester carboxylesterase
VYLLEFTGNATRAEDIAAYVAGRLGGRAVEAWVVNYPGYGGSTGPARLKDIPGAALAAYDELRKVAGDRPIVVSGNSLGTAAALWVAAERPGVAGVVLQNPPPLRQLIMGRFGWWNLWMGAGVVAAGVPAELDSVRNGKRVKAPGVFVLGERDELVWPNYQRMVVDAYAGEKQVITVRGGTHNSPLDEEATEEVVGGFDWIVRASGRGVR